MNSQQLLKIAMNAREYAYVPYSHFSVGAALLTKDGKVYTGCNIENAAYTPSNCAERTAIFKAISEGHKEFLSIAVVGGIEGQTPTSFCAPCGVCRQVLREFVEPDTFLIILGRKDCNSDDNICEFTLDTLLPESFGPNNLNI